MAMKTEAKRPRKEAQVVDRVPRFRMALPSLSRGRVHEILPDRWVVSSEEFCRSFDWEPQEPFPLVLKATYDWYRRSGQLRRFCWLGLKARHLRVAETREGRDFPGCDSQ